MIVVLFILWIIFYGRFSTETVLLGAVVCSALYVFLWKFLGYSPSTDRKIVRFLLRGIHYTAVLIWETGKANLYVSKLVYSRKIEIRPQMVFFRTKLKSTAARVALANSITLTPGTLTIVLTDDLFCVHCLNSDLAEDLSGSVFVKLLEKFER